MRTAPSARHRRGPSAFRTRVFAIVRSVPRGRLVTYGQVALLCGVPRAAQAVGWALHTAPDDVPCHRVVNRSGGLADAFPWGGVATHRALLEAEGVAIREDLTADLQRHQWWPSPEVVAELQLPDDVLARVGALLGCVVTDARTSRRRGRS